MIPYANERQNLTEMRALNYFQLDPKSHLITDFVIACYILQKVHFNVSHFA